MAAMAARGKNEAQAAPWMRLLAIVRSKHQSKGTDAAAGEIET